MSHIHNKLNLYRRSRLSASIIVLAVATLALSARAFQRSSPHKLRATALLELTTDQSGTVTARLYPITILADGRFRDATIYESKPRPMALGTGVVYEAQKTGTPVGYLTIGGAINSLQGWVGEGKWQLPRETKASSTPKPAAPAAPADDRPILHRGGDSSPAPQPDQSPAPSSTPPSDDRPVLHRSGGDNSPQSSSPPPASQPDETPPPDPNRPVLRHRKPGDEDTESKPTPKNTPPPPSATPTPQTVTSKPLPASTPGVQTYVAVSDAQTSDIRSYEYNWRPDEKEKIEAKMRKLALAQLPGEHSQTNEHSLTNVVVRSFDLDMSNDAVVVITAEAPGAFLAPAGKTPRGAPAPKTPPPAGDKFVSRYITVIARVDIDGNPQKLAASITDSSRLDVAPRLELIDAVDVDGDGLAELLFREYGFDQKTFLIYGVGHGTVTKVFEGTGEPLDER